jgi:type IV pilus assembly protein PilY1
MRFAARATRSIAGLLAWCLPVAAPWAAPEFTLAPYPLFLASSVKPNLMVIFDNSQSMDATMGGKVISGNDPTTRANIARGVLRGVIEGYRGSFNWGLTTFETTYDTLYNTQAYFLGTAATMVYTNDCVAGVSASNAGLRCLPNPEPANGFAYLTYEISGDDASINDVYYTNNPLRQYGVGKSGNTFDLWTNKTTGATWDGFSGGPDTVTFTPTDAGFLPDANVYKRALFQNRGWGYYGDITGAGKINEVVQTDSDAHIDRLRTLLGNETNNSTGEVKNSALFTPLAGSLQTVRNYFGRGLSASQKSPVTDSCQSNFVVLATDGNPTGRLNGSQYNPADWVNTQDATTGQWTFGQAQTDVFSQITALRSTALSGPNLSAPALDGRTLDIKTYIIGMGDTVANASSVAALNRMAELGGAQPTAFLGSSSDALNNAFQTIVGNIQSRVGAGGSVALNAGSWTTGSRAYQARFNSTDWSGTVLAYPVDANGSTGSTPAWDAAARLGALNWNTQRNVITYKPTVALGARGVKFRWPANAAAPTALEIDAAQAAALNLDAAGNNDGFGAQRLDYLRGDTSRERRRCATAPCAAPQFRDRPNGVLGDIVNSAPYYVAAPAFGYFDDFESAPYSSFVSTYRNRTPMIYVGANDGMLHAFNATTGDEAFAYIPAALYGSLTQLSNPNYGHRYYVDGTPTVGDVFYGGAWHSLLVSGMRSGAKGIFALDVTNPTSFSEATAATVARWEFQDPDLGYVFSQPLLVKTNNGRWSVVVSGGYQAGNASGHAVLFVLDAETGALLSKIDTGSGTAASPNGLSSPAAIDSNGDGIVDVVYAGDLNGNLWKFDLSSTTAASWGLGNAGLALFATPGGQPITARPDVTRFPRGGFLVGFGTGRYLATTDQTDTSAQAVYAIWDNNGDATVTLSQLQQQTIVETAARSGIDYRLSTHAVGPAGDAGVTGDNVISRNNFFTTRKGWYLNLPTAGERVVADARFRGGRLVLTSIIPDSSSGCAFGGTGWLLEYDAITGNRLDTAAFDTNGDRQVDSNDFVLFPTSNPSGSNNVSGRRLGAISAAPGFMDSGNVDLRLLNKADGTVDTVIASPGASRPGRAMWREVQ